MSNPVISPDGKMQWDGIQWIPYNPNQNIIQNSVVMGDIKTEINYQQNISTTVNNTIQLNNTPNALTRIWGILILIFGVLNLFYIFFFDAWFSIAGDYTVALLMFIGSIISSVGLLVSGGLIASYKRSGIYVAFIGVVIAVILGQISE